MVFHWPLVELAGRIVAAIQGPVWLGVATVAVALLWTARVRRSTE